MLACFKEFQGVHYDSTRKLQFISVSLKIDPYPRLQNMMEEKTREKSDILE